MIEVSIRCYGNLNDFLSKERAWTTFIRRLHNCASVKDVLESSGVPHTEIRLLLIDGRPVSFGALVANGQRIAAYPNFTQLPIDELMCASPSPPKPFRFVADVHLGKLARNLRMAGFDVWYHTNASDQTLAETAHAKDAILLTFDRELLKRNLVTYGYCVRSRNPKKQLREVLDRFDAVSSVRLFTRCLVCNACLERINKNCIEHRLPHKVRERFDLFHRCTGCDKIYWKGSHYETMCKELANNGLAQNNQTQAECTSFDR